MPVLRDLPPGPNVASRFAAHYSQYPSTQPPRGNLRRIAYFSGAFAIGVLLGTLGTGVFNTTADPDLEASGPDIADLGRLPHTCSTGLGDSRANL